MAANPITDRRQTWRLLVTLASSCKGDVFVEDVMDEEVCNRQQAIAYLRDWERQEWGKVIVGRRGSSTRFRTRQRLYHDDINRTFPSNAANFPSKALEWTHHSFVIRDGVAISLSLPADISFREAKRLAKFVETLPL